MSTWLKCKILKQEEFHKEYLYRVIYELHRLNHHQPEALDTLLEENGIMILTNSTHRLSGYHSASGFFRSMLSIF